MVYTKKDELENCVPSDKNQSQQSPAPSKKKKYICECGVPFTELRNLNKHKKMRCKLVDPSNKKKVSCKCGASFSHCDSLKTHKKTWCKLDPSNEKKVSCECGPNTELYNLVTEESLGFFSIIKMDDNWLDQPVDS